MSRAFRLGGLFSLLLAAIGCATPPKKIAAIVSVYNHNSHADAIVGRLIETHTLDGKGPRPNLQLVSLYTDQVPIDDKSRRLAAKHGFAIYTNVADTLTLGTGKLAVDGVLFVIEHGKYPTNELGATIYPKRRLFEEVTQVFRDSKRAVPVFVDKALADNWRDAKWLYDAARELNAPLMAGSSLPVLWRKPPADVRRGAKLKEIVALSYHTLDHYGFHALEIVQCLAERRANGETGVRAVQCLVGDAVWVAGEQGMYDKELLAAAWSRLEPKPSTKKPVRELVKEPVLWSIEYTDGLRATILTLNGAVTEWAAAWREADGRSDSTLFWTQEARPLGHFTSLMDGVERMFHTGKPTWPAERTLMTSGLLDALLTSKKQGGARLDTPHLMFGYRSDWNWHTPPPPAPPRPFTGQ